MDYLELVDALKDKGKWGKVIRATFSKGNYFFLSYDGETDNFNYQTKKDGRFKLDVLFTNHLTLFNLDFQFEETKPMNFVEFVESLENDSNHQEAIRTTYPDGSIEYIMYLSYQNLLAPLIENKEWFTIGDSIVPFYALTKNTFEYIKG